MRFAEVFLRLGCALVAWMVLYAHFVWLAVLGSVGCGPDGDELYRVLLGLVPITIACAFLLRMTRPLEEIHRMLRWLALPLAALGFAGAYQAYQVSRSVAVTGLGICSTSAAAPWHQAWGPAQLLTVGVGLVMMVRVWRKIVSAETI